MKPEKENTKPDKAEEPAADYTVSYLKKGVVDETFDFDAEFEKGYTLEEFRDEMIKRIKAYPWKK